VWMLQAGRQGAAEVQKQSLSPPGTSPAMICDVESASTQDGGRRVRMSGVKGEKCLAIVKLQAIKQLAS
jgi:hypothetical protein